MKTRLLFLLAALLAQSAFAAENRLYILDQSDFNGKKGFYVSFENDTGTGVICKLSTLRLCLGVADGKQWQFAVTRPKFSYGQVLNIMAVIEHGKGTLYLDENQLDQIHKRLDACGSNGRRCRCAFVGRRAG